jgi:Ca2+-binding RTX toxin-like protein
MVNRKLVGALVSGTAFAIAAFTPSIAGAAVTCSFTAATGKVTVALTAGSDSVTLRRSGSAIQANGVNCGAATVSNTDLIRVDDDVDPAPTVDSFQAARIDLGGGAFGPGKTAEATGTSEIEFEINLGPGTGEEVQVIGATGNDRAAFGTAGAMLNTDADLDLTFSGLDQVELDGADGADTLSVGGTVAGTGSPLYKPSDIDGGNGIDTLDGGRRNDTMVGGADGDTVHGGASGDTLKGGTGADSVYGDADGDYVDGDADADNLFGGGGADYLNYYGGSSPDGADVISGGPGANDYLWLASRVSNTIVKLDDVANDGADADANGAAEEGDNVKADVEYVQTGNGSDTIDARFPIARTVAHSFDANLGNDKLYGGDEGDSLYGDADADTLTGGDGNDTLYGYNGTDTLTAGDGNDTIYPEGSDSASDTINAGAGDDYIDAGSASSGLGPDSYTGGPGFDRVYYGSRLDDLDIVANDVADDGTDVDGTPGGEEGDNVRSDVERVDTGSGDDYIAFNTVPANAVAADNEVYASSGNDDIRVGAGEDYVDAGEGTDKINGGGGEDTSYGRGGADAFTMNDGFFDFIDGGAGDGLNDTCSCDAIDQKSNFP